MTFQLHRAYFGELDAANWDALAAVVSIANEKVVAFGADQIFEHGESAEGIALTTTKKAAGTGTGGLMYAEDEYLRNPPALGGKQYSLLRRAYLVGAMRAARAGKRTGLYHLAYCSIAPNDQASVRAQNDAARELIGCKEASYPDVYLPNWNVAADFYQSMVGPALQEAMRVPNELGIPTYPFVQLWTTNAERDLTDREIAAISPKKLAALGCAGMVPWGWAKVGTPGILDRANANIVRAAKIWSWE